MEKHLRIPLIYLFVASLIGVLLRVQLVFPIPSIHYTNFLHAHSHMMFLGWLFNFFYLVFVSKYIKRESQSAFTIIFYLLQIMNIGMFIAFPIQGYAFWSITFSTLHTILAIIFILIFFKRTKGRSLQSLALAKVSLIFFAISSVGPFALGYVMANDLKFTNWYNYAIYFYLHFQYNGFFFFGMISLFMSMMERYHVVDSKRLQVLWNALAIAVFPCYFLSILYANPGVVYNVIGFLGAAVQLIIFFTFVVWLNRNNVMSLAGRLKAFAILFLVFIALKFLLQLLSAWPSVALMAYSFRPIIIAYLHLVLVGIISSFILMWYKLNGLMEQRFLPVFSGFIVTFIFMELVLVAMPWWPLNVTEPTYLLLATAGILSICCLLFTYNFNLTDKNQGSL